MKRTCVAIAAIALAAAAPAVRAQELPKKWGSIEVGGGPYIPNVDDEFGNTPDAPYRAVFGGQPSPMFRFHIGKTILQSRTLGALELGFKTGFWSKAGNALNRNTNAPTGDSARFTILPTSLTLTYRADPIYERFRVPLVPYARIALERYNWWTTKEESWTGHGATNGWSATAGVAFLLDWMDPDAARDLGNEAGIAHTSLYFDLTKSKVDDFGSNESWDLSDNVNLFWSGGVMVVF